MSSIFFILITLCLFSTIYSSEVIKLTEKDISTKVFNTKDIWIVGLINTDETKNSLQFQEMLLQLLPKVNIYNIKIGIFYCNLNKITKKICINLNANNQLNLGLFSDIPTVNPYTHKLYRIPQFFNENAENLRKIEKFITNNIKPINYEKIENNIINNIDSIINTIERPLLLYLVGKNNGNVKNLLYKTIAIKYNNYLNLKIIKSINNNIESINIIHNNDSKLYFIDISHKINEFFGNLNNKTDISLFIESFINVTSDTIPKINNNNNENILKNNINIKKISQIYYKNNLTENIINNNLNEEIIIAIFNQSINEIPG